MSTRHSITRTGRARSRAASSPRTRRTASFDLDHDQRLSIVGSATYAPNRFFLSGTAIYGSGLTNGVDPADCGCTIGTGLFDFNKGIHVDPSTIINASTGYTFVAGRGVFQPQIYVENLLNKKYALKGAFFSGASVGRPRSVQVRLKARSDLTRGATTGHVEPAPGCD